MKSVRPAQAPNQPNCRCAVPVDSALPMSFHPKPGRAPLPASPPPLVPHKLSRLPRPTPVATSLRPSPQEQVPEQAAAAVQQQEEDDRARIESELALQRQEEEAAERAHAEAVEAEAARQEAAAAEAARAKAAEEEAARQEAARQEAARQEAARQEAARQEQAQAAAAQAAAAQAAAAEAAAAQAAAAQAAAAQAAAAQAAAAPPAEPAVPAEPTGDVVLMSSSQKAQMFRSILTTFCGVQLPEVNAASSISHAPAVGEEAVALGSIVGSILDEAEGKEHQDVQQDLQENLMYNLLSYYIARLENGGSILQSLSQEVHPVPAHRSNVRQMAACLCVCVMLQA